MKFYLYSLVRPGESFPFYIGITENWKKRFRVHQLKFGDSLVGSFIGEFQSKAEAYDAETAAIKYWLSQKVSLVNTAKTPNDPRYKSGWPARRLPNMSRLAKLRKQRKCVVS